MSPHPPLREHGGPRRHSEKIEKLLQQRDRRITKRANGASEVGQDSVLPRSRPSALVGSPLLVARQRKLG
jgi:hypothetical protein